MLADKIYALRTENKYSQKDVAEGIGVSQPAYSKWEKGQTVPSKENLEKLADFYKTSVSVFEENENVAELLMSFNELGLLRQKEVIKFSNQQLEAQKNENVIYIQERRELNEVKVFERLSAGLGAGLAGDGDYDIVYTEDPLPRYDIASWVDGDSMEPKYLNGSVVLIRDTVFDYDGAVYAVSVDDTLFLKRVYKEEEGLRLVSINSKNKDRFISYDDNPVIVGKIVGNFDEKQMVEA